MIILLKVVLSFLVSLAAAICCAACIGGAIVCSIDMYEMLMSQFRRSRRDFWILVGAIAGVVILTATWFSWIFPWMCQQPV